MALLNWHKWKRNDIVHLLAGSAPRQEGVWAAPGWATPKNKWQMVEIKQVSGVPHVEQGLRAHSIPIDTSTKNGTEPQRDEGKAFTLKRQSKQVTLQDPVFTFSFPRKPLIKKHIESEMKHCKVSNCPSLCWIMLTQPSWQPILSREWCRCL